METLWRCLTLSAATMDSRVPGYSGNAWLSLRGQVLRRAVSVCLVLLSTSSRTSEQSLAPKLSSPAGPKLAPAFSLWRKRLLSGFRSRPCTLSHEARHLGRIPTLTLEPQGHFILPFRLGGLELLGWPRTHGLRKE